jgi:hypothetical protein
MTTTDLFLADLEREAASTRLWAIWLRWMPVSPRPAPRWQAQPMTI